MPLNYFRGDGVAAEAPVKIVPTILTPRLKKDLRDPSRYLTSERLARAVNVAIALQTPLLVSGEPGCGKTELGAAIAHELGKIGPLLFVTRSASSARDMFYQYDAVSHFHAAQSQSGEIDARDFLTYRAMGLAVLLAMPRAQRGTFLSARALKRSALAAQDPEQIEALLEGETQHQSVVIIDEIDKASRDVPNDLLDQIEHSRFDIPELGGAATPLIDPAFRPILVITTNTERQLPEAFLRRCVYAHCEFPNSELLVEISRRRLGDAIGSSQTLLDGAIDLFNRVRVSDQLTKKPGTAEFLGWLQVMLEDGADPALPLSEQRRAASLALGVLGKLREDNETVETAIRRYFEE